MTDVPLLPSPQPMDRIDGQLIVIPARDIVDWVVDKLSSLDSTDYNLDELGAVLVETLDREWFANAEQLALGAAFSDHMARRFGSGEAEYQFLVPIFDEMYGMMAQRIANLHLENLGHGNHLGISFYLWNGRDLVVRHHPVPY